MNLTPDAAGTINYIRNQGLTSRDVIGELIDNAFDASATTISISFERSGKALDLIVKDDGNGCSDLESMLTLGKHIRQPGTRLGRYGVGLKDAAIWLGGITQIVTVKGGTQYRVQVDWDHLPRWDELPDPVQRPAEPGERGTRIIFHNIERQPPHGSGWDSLVREIGYLFTPAIKAGRQITMKPAARNSQTAVAPRFSLPSLTDIVDVDLAVDGKALHVHVGVVKEGESNPRPGINYTHGFRVIIPASSLGCGEYSSARISGWVALGESWRLTKNKNDLSAHKDELGAAVYEAIRSVVQKAAGQAAVLQSSALASNLTGRLRAAWRDENNIKSKRSPGDKKGAIDPAGSKRRQRRADEAQPGHRVLQRMQAGNIRVEFAHCEPPLIGEVDAPGNTIRLAQNHTFIAQLMKNNNQEALLAMVVSLLVEHDKGQLCLDFGNECGTGQRFSHGLGKVLTSVEFGGLRVVSAA